MVKQKVRVRFAPSPTGPLHIGGVRTALYNYLFACKHQGSFILRIEDTDQTRFVAGAEEYIIESLAWCGISFDEGTAEGGPFGPYRQSERKHIYSDYAMQLVNSGHAYYAFDKAEELETMREQLKREKATNLAYSHYIRGRMKNSLSMSKDEVQKKLASGTPYVIRLKIEADENIEINDIIRGKINVNTNELDDKVLFKSDGMPTYHLANVIDDYLMQITHVIRGEEWLPSAPLHVLLYKYLGWEEAMPVFAHLPLILKPTGDGKLSKRDGDRMGFPVFPINWRDPRSGEIYSGYRESGYLPGAFVNILAFLGWNPGTEQEIFSMEEMTASFSLDRVGKSGSKFDPEKAIWYNEEYIKSTDNKILAEIFKIDIISRGFKYDPLFTEKVCGLIKGRISLLTDFWNAASYFFKAPTSYDQDIISKKWKENTPEIIEKLSECFTALPSFNAKLLEETFEKFLQENVLSAGAVLFPLRFIITGSTAGPSVFDILSLLGKEEGLQRMSLFHPK